MIPTIDELRAYGRIPKAEPDSALKIFLDAAVESMIHQGVQPHRVAGSSLYKLAVLMLATYFYEHRGELADPKVSQPPAGVMAIVTQLHY